MAKKKKRKRPYTPPAQKASPATATQTEATGRAAAPVRHRNKEEARRARERALRQLRRRQAIRRVITIVVVATVIGGVFFFLTRVGTPELSEEAVAAAQAADCSGLEQQADRGGGHPGPPYDYADSPATSGPHDPNPLSAGIYTEPQPEERLVHSMEHAYAVLYYRAEDPGRVADGVLTALEDLAEDEDKVILAPYTQLPEGTAVAFAGWNYLMTCPGTIDAAQVRAIGESFIEEFRGSSRAPEPNGL